jgi:hypothetical protein
MSYFTAIEAGCRCRICVSSRGHVRARSHRITLVRRRECLEYCGRVPRSWQESLASSWSRVCRQGRCCRPRAIALALGQLLPREALPILQESDVDSLTCTNKLAVRGVLVLYRQKPILKCTVQLPVQIRSPGSRGNLPERG